MRLHVTTCACHVVQLQTNGYVLLPAICDNMQLTTTAAVCMRLRATAYDCVRLRATACVCVGGRCREQVKLNVIDGIMILE